MKKTKADTIRFEDDLMDQLKDPEFAAHFLSEVLNDHSPGRNERVVLALKRMTKAYGVKALTKKIGRSPKALYVSLAKDGNPKLDTFFSILDVLGIQLSATARETPAPTPQQDDAA